MALTQEEKRDTQSRILKEVAEVRELLDFNPKVYWESYPDGTGVTGIYVYTYEEMQKQVVKAYALLEEVNMSIALSLVRERRETA